MEDLHKRKISLKRKRKGFFFDSREIEEKYVDRKPTTKSKRSIKIYNCDTCPQKKRKRSQYVEGHGNKESRFLWLGRDPGRVEVEIGKPFVGKAGEVLRRAISAGGWDITELFYLDNVSRCRPVGDKFSKAACRCCYDNIEQLIEEMKPLVIVTLGKEATERILGYCSTMGAFHGKVVPCHRYNCVVIPLYHPSYIFRRISTMAEQDYQKAVSTAIETGYNYITARSRDYSLSTFLESRKLNYRIREITSIKQFRNVAKLIRKAGAFSIDFENNTAKVYTEGTKLFIGALGVLVPIKGKAITFGYWFKMADDYGFWTEEERAEFEEILIDLATDKKLIKVIQNSKHEDHCFRHFIGCELAEPIRCTMINQHIIDSTDGATSMETQALMYYGIRYKHKTDAMLKPQKGQRYNRIHKIDVEVLGERCALDSIIAMNLDGLHKDILHSEHPFYSAYPEKVEACTDFLMSGIKAFTEYEQRGINIDIELLDELKEEWEGLSEEIHQKILRMPTVKRYERTLSKNLNLNSNDQLRTLLFGKGYFNLEPIKETGIEKVASTDEETLKTYADDNLFCRLLLERKKINRLVSTYINNIKLYIGEDGRLHPDFWLHSTATYRSSSSKINFQNIPVRYELTGELEAKALRKVFIPSHDDWELLEVDYSGNEIKGLWMFCRDQKLLEDLNNKVDMHKMQAARLNEISEKEVDYTWRDITKHKSVFASFYGAKAASIYQSIKDIPEFKNAHRGEAFIEQWQDHLFGRYPHIKLWQERTINDYSTDGYVKLLTNFVRLGPLDRNQLINTGIQGTSFHLLLNSCIEIENVINAKNGFRTRAIGQIHDSIVFDGPKEERNDVIAKVNEIMLNPPWGWAKGVLLETEWSAGPNWLDMVELEEKDGKWI